MNPFLDQLLVALLILAALGYLWRALAGSRSGGKSKGCAAGCGCPGAKLVPKANRDSPSEPASGPHAQP
jgi:hypothetical protein